MCAKRNYSSLTRFILLLFISGTPFYSQNTFAQNDPEAIAKEYFELGKYEEALPHFKDLVNLYPKDQMLNYYYAACLVETEQFTPEAKTTIQNAFGNNSPAQIFYYQAQISHADNDFQTALNYYQQFIDKAKKKVVKTTNVNELIELCRQNINPFSKIEEPKVEEAIKDEQVEEIKPVKEIKETIVIPSNLKDSIIHFQVTPSIHYLKINHFKDKASAQAFIQAWIIEQDINNALTKTNRLREDYSKANNDEKVGLAEKILQLEKETYNSNLEIKEFYNKAREKEIAFWNEANPESVSDFQRKISNLEDSISNTMKVQNFSETEVLVPIELPEEKIEAIVQESQSQTTNKVVYKIQIGAYKKSPPQWVQDLFKKLSVIRKIDNYTDDKGVTVYTVGELSSFEDAIQMQSQVRQEGVKDAFVAAYKDNERISVKEARKLTN